MTYTDGTWVKYKASIKGNLKLAKKGQLIAVVRFGVGCKSGCLLVL